MKHSLTVTFFVAMVLTAPGCSSRAHAALGDCSQPVSGGATPTASDCLFILQAAVGSQTCTPSCICDPTGGGGITASDALTCLKKAVGQEITLNCPCGGTTTTSSTTLTTATTTTTGLGGTTTTIPSGGGQPALVAGDFPGVSPCADRDTLPDDATFLAAVNASDRVHIVVNFTQFNTQGMPEICGITDIDNSLTPQDIPWDPSRDNSFNVCNFFTDNVVDFFVGVPTGHGPDMCQTGNDQNTPAMPRAGTYRKDVCIEGSGNSYDVRTRVVVSGPDVDKTLAELGITRADIRICDGTTEIATQAQAKAFLAANPTDIAFTVKSGSCASGPTHLEVQSTIICVKKRSAPCPPPTFGDSHCFG